MSRIPDRDHQRLLVLIEQMQRDGQPEHAIHNAVRQATGRTQPKRQRPARQSGRVGLFGRHR